MPDIDSIKSSAVDDNMSTARLPIVDISPYLYPESTSEARYKTAQTLDKACREFGEQGFQRAEMYC